MAVCHNWRFLSYQIPQATFLKPIFLIQFLSQLVMVNMQYITMPCMMLFYIGYDEANPDLDHLLGIDEIRQKKPVHFFC